MDGLPEVQNFQRPLPNGTPSYPLIEDNLKKLAQSKCSLKVRCTVTQYSVNKMSETVKFLYGLGVKRIHFEPVTAEKRGINNDSSLQAPSSKDFVENLKKAIEIGAQLSMDIICFSYMNMMIASVDGINVIESSANERCHN